MDVSKMEFARKDIKTPKKEPGKLNTGSRPGSPERDHTLMVYKLFIWFRLHPGIAESGHYKGISLLHHRFR